MDLTDLSSLIKALHPSFRSPEQQQLDAIVTAWAIALGSEIATNSRPICYERHSLTIAVRQAIWAQQLTAQTHQILQHLRPNLPAQLTIKTLRFRVAPHLCQAPQQAPSPPDSTTATPHPSHWPITPPNLNISNLNPDILPDDAPATAIDPTAQRPNPRNQPQTSANHRSLEIQPRTPCPPPTSLSPLPLPDPPRRTRSLADVRPVCHLSLQILNAPRRRATSLPSRTQIRIVLHPLQRSKIRNS